MSIPAGYTAESYSKELRKLHNSRVKATQLVKASHLQREFDQSEYERQALPITNAIGSLQTSITGLSPNDISLLKFNLTTQQIKDIDAEPNVSKKRILAQDALSKKTTDPAIQQQLTQNAIDLLKITQQKQLDKAKDAAGPSGSSSILDSLGLDPVRPPSYNASANENITDLISLNLAWRSVYEPLFNGKTPNVSNPDFKKFVKNSNIKSREDLINLRADLIQISDENEKKRPPRISKPTFTPTPTKGKDKKVIPVVSLDSPPIVPFGGHGLGKSNVNSHKLKLILGSINAGNKSKALNRQAMDIMDKMLISKQITKAQHKKLYKML